MSNEQADNEFWNIADSFIHLANEHMDKHPEGKVSSAMLYAAARFNAFIVASAADADLKEEKDAAIEYFSGQYKNMFKENIEDYESNPLK